MALIKCSECGKEISSLATACIGCGAPTTVAKKSLKRTKEEPVVIYKTASSAGVLTGILGSLFAILGLFMFAILFLPFAILFSLISLLRSVTSPNVSGVMLALVSSVLTVICFVTSPTAILAALAILGIAASSNEPVRSSEPVRTTKQDSLLSCGSAGCFPANNSPEAIAAAEEYTKRAAQEFEREYPTAQCPELGATVTVSGIANRWGDGWMLQIDKPFCVTFPPPPRIRRGKYSTVQIEGSPPPIGTRIELTGTLSYSASQESLRLTVTSGRRLE